MKFLKFFVAAAVAASLQLQSSAASATEVAVSQPQPEVKIPFNPPLGERLFYRSLRVSKAPSGNETSERFFAVGFEREGSGFRMIASKIRKGGRAASSPVPPILIEQTFHLDAEGSLIGMEDESAYWAALEIVLQGENDAREREGMVRLMSDTRGMPLSDRLNWISDEFRSILAFAGTNVPKSVTEYPEVRQTIVGPIVGRFQLSTERVTDEMIVFNQTWQIPAEQLQQTLAELTARFGRESADYGDLVRGQATRTRVEVDRVTGLVRRYTQIQEIRTDRDGVSLNTTMNKTVERAREP